MLPGMELMGCQDLAVPPEVMQHVVGVESAFNPYAIGVVGARLARQPRNVSEALATARVLEERGYNFSLGLAQVNRHNLKKYGLHSYERAFEACPNLQAGARILAECHGRSGGDWGKSFSCYYSGNFVTGFRHGYVQKVFASMQGARAAPASAAIAIAGDATVAEASRPSRRLPIRQQSSAEQTDVHFLPNPDLPPVVLAATGNQQVADEPVRETVPVDRQASAAGPIPQRGDDAFVF